MEGNIFFFSSGIIIFLFITVSRQTDLEPLPHFLYPAGIIISEQIESSES
jgi:hypothetical protein